MKIIILALIAALISAQVTYSTAVADDCASADLMFTFGSTSAYGYIVSATCEEAAAGDATVAASCSYIICGGDYTSGGTPEYTWAKSTTVETDLTQTVSALDTGAWDQTETSCSNASTVITCVLTADLTTASTYHYATNTGTEGATVFNTLTWTEFSCDSSSSATYVMSLAASVFAF